MQQSFPRNVVKTTRRKYCKPSSLWFGRFGPIFEKYVEKEMGKESTPTNRIKNLCSECFKRPKFVKIMSNSQADELKIKVRRQVCRNTTTLQFNFDKT